MFCKRINSALKGCVLITCLLFVSAFAADEQSAEQRVDNWLGEINLPTRNYVSDGSFENGAEGWTWFVHKCGEIVNETAGTGKSSFRMGANDPSKVFYFYRYNIPLETGKTYTFSARIKTQGMKKEVREFGNVFLTDYYWTGNSIALRMPEEKEGWVRVSKTFVAPPTRARPDGKPTYHIAFYWPPKSPGQMWVDDVLVEEGDKVGEYSNLYIGDAIEAKERLRSLASQIFEASDAIANFPHGVLVDQLSSQIKQVKLAAASIRDDLKSFANLSQSDQKNIGRRIDQAAAQLADLRMLSWTGTAHLPLREVSLPDALPDDLQVEATCLQGEHRDVALNLVPMAAVGHPMKVTPSVLYNSELALSVPANDWLDIYTVPRIRGFQKTDEIQSDPLPRMNDAGVCELLPGRINQVIFSVNTTQLPPGEYEGSVQLDSLTSADSSQTMTFKVKVLPEAILPLTDVNIAECFGHVDYAWQAMLDLGVNTFDVNTAWIDVAFDSEGNLTRAGFERIDTNIDRILAAVPDAQFLFIGGHNMGKRVGFLTGWKHDDPKFKKAFQAWTKAIVKHFASRGIAANRLVVETYDEPGVGDYPEGTRLARWFEEVEPDLRTHFYGGIVQDELWKNHVAEHDVVAPILSAVTPDNMAFVNKLGKELWVYDCQADGETLHPIAYYRLMPWTCYRYGITGWGHYSWFNTSHDRPYRPWQGVEAQNLVYPAADGKDYVISRRFLALRAGQEDYRVIRTLERLSKKAARQSQTTKLINDACDKAISIAPRRKGYESTISKDLPVDQLDTLRKQLIAEIEQLLPVERSMTASLDEAASGTSLMFDAPVAGTLTVRYLLDGKLPWRELKQDVAKGQAKLSLLQGSGDVSRCITQLLGEDGSVYASPATIIPTITVDSTAISYTAKPLNDGIRNPAAKFEPKLAWISEPTAGEHWVELDLGKERYVNEVKLYWMTYTSLPSRVTLRYQDDAGQWQTVPEQPTWRKVTQAVETVRFPMLKTRKLRVVQAHLGGGVVAPAMMGMSEVEVR